jgi:glutamyl-tRNA synthetase
VVAGAEQSQRDDLDWLGIEFDEGCEQEPSIPPDDGLGSRGPVRQSDRGALYEAAIAKLASLGRTYLCDCSRADIARVANAPHLGDEGPRYPGTCRGLGMHPRAFKRPPAVRLAVPDGLASWVDERGREHTSDVARETGDYVLRRGDGVFAYQLAVVVDDLAMGITEVVRGADLRSSAARQAQLARLLGGDAPSYAHVPLLVDEHGARLAKRTGGSAIGEHRAAGVRPRALLAAIAGAYGHEVDARGDVVGAVANRLDFARFPSGGVRIGEVLERLGRGA